MWSFECKYEGKKPIPPDLMVCLFHEYFLSALLYFIGIFVLSVLLLLLYVHSTVEPGYIEHSKETEIGSMLRGFVISERLSRQIK